MAAFLVGLAMLGVGDRASAPSITIVFWWDRSDRAGGAEVEEKVRSSFAELELPLSEHANTSGTPNLPATCALGQLRAAIDAARATAGPDLIVTRFTDSDFREVDSRRGFLKLADLTDLLRWVTLQKDVRVRTPDGLETSGLTADRLSTYRKLTADNALPLGPFEAEFLTYPPHARLETIRRTQVAALWVGGAVGVLAGVAAGLVAVRWSVRKRRAFSVPQDPEPSVEKQTGEVEP